MMLDIDNFKNINDRYGHHFGDAFLQAFAKLLHAAVRDGDIVARYGGDEFCIIMPDAADTQAHMVAQRIKEMLEEFSVATPDGNKLRTTQRLSASPFARHTATPPKISS